MIDENVQGENFGGDGNILPLAQGSGYIICIYVCQNSLISMLKMVHLLYVNHTSKLIKNRNTDFQRATKKQGF